MSAAAARQVCDVCRHPFKDLEKHRLNTGHTAVRSLCKLCNKKHLDLSQHNYERHQCHVCKQMFIDPVVHVSSTISCFQIKEDYLYEANEVLSVFNSDSDLKALLYQNFQYCRTHFHEGRFVNTYVYRTFHNDGDSVDGAQMVCNLWKTFYNQVYGFYANISWAFVLVHKETGEYRYFHASPNNARYLDRPMLVRNATDFDRFVKSVTYLPAVEQFLLEGRDDTKYALYMITNFSLYCRKLETPLNYHHV